MALALYADNLGYYRTQTPFGRQGDFVTAPELTPLFARCIAETCKRIGGDIVEYGAGSGVFAKDLLHALHEADALPAHYWIIETSPSLRASQAALLKTACPDWFSRIQWCDTPPADIHGTIFANEVLDALPFDCFQVENGRLFERQVIWAEDHFDWCLTPPSPSLAACLPLIPPLPDGYHSEIRPALPAFVQNMAKNLREGLLLIVDYGYGRHSYFHPDRIQGTLSCFVRHHRHTNPLILPGLQDITAHVDFTMVAEAAQDAGLFLTGFATQTAFLLGSGLLTLAEPKPDDSAAAIWHQAQMIKKLTLPDEMGEVIKVIGFSPDLGLMLPAFLLKECREDL